MRGMSLGNLTLPASKDEKTEACLELLSSPALDGKTVVLKNLANIQWTRVSNRRRPAPRSDDNATDSKSNTNDNIQTGDSSSGGSPAGYGQDSSSSSGISTDSQPAASTDAIPVAVPAPGLDLSGRYSWVHRVASRAARVSSAQDAWTALRLKHAWTDGQSVLESMFSPYDSEGIEECPAELHAACRPQI
jgi:hypothetical protein